MQKDDNILDLLREKGFRPPRQAQRGLILQPGAIGDCVLTLPLAKFMKEQLELDGIDILGHTEYTGILVGRCCVDGIRSIDSLDLHRLFAEPKAFDLPDRDPLIDAFAGYSWIVTFLGEPDSSFEKNLIFIVHCSHSADVITLSMKPPKACSAHITDFFIKQFIEQSNLPLEPLHLKGDEVLIKATKVDINRGKELLEEMRIDSGEKLVVIHPGSGGEQKCWHLNNFLAVAKELGSKGNEVIFLLGPAESERFDRAAIKNISSVAKCLDDLSLMQVLGLLGCADAFIGNDSGITHLASALGVRTLAIFGPTDPAIYGPIGPDVTVFTSRSKTFARKPSVSQQRKLLKIFDEKTAKNS